MYVIGKYIKIYSCMHNMCIRAYPHMYYVYINEYKCMDTLTFGQIDEWLDEQRAY